LILKKEKILKNTVDDNSNGHRPNFFSTMDARVFLFSSPSRPRKQKSFRKSLL
jgi:hypothetical protein